MRRFNTSKPTQRSNEFKLEVEHLEERQMLSTVQIFAAGTTGHEQLELRIDNQVVANFEVGDGADSRQFDVLTFQSDEAIDIRSLKVSFVNDFYDPENGIDSNLVVDRVVVDGTEYQTENFRTYATALYTSENGVSSGRFETETLNVNGGFRYSEFGASPDTRTTIAIDATGTTGDELLQLSIDGEVVRTFELSGRLQTLLFTADRIITGDQLRLTFTNDLFDPTNGIDRNITIRDVRLSDANSEVSLYDGRLDRFSTGTFVEGTGVVPGVNLGEVSDTLHTNGFLEFQAISGRSLADAVAAFAARNPSEFIEPTVSREAIDEQGRIYRRISNSFSPEFDIVRFSEGNQLDPTFGNNGSVTVPTSDFARLVFDSTLTERNLEFDSQGNIGIVFNVIELTGMGALGRGQFINRFDFIGTEFVKLDVNGNFVDSFGDNGRLFVPFEDGNSIFVQDFNFNQDDQFAITGKRVEQSFTDDFSGIPDTVLLLNGSSLIEA